MNRRQLLIFLAAPLVGLVGFALCWSALPASIATHFEANGQADDFTDKSIGLVALSIGLPLITGGLVAVLLLIVPPEAPFLSGIRSLPIGFIWFLTGVTTLGVLAQAGQSPSTQSLPGWLLPVALVLGGSAWFVGFKLSTPTAALPARSGPLPVDAPRLDAVDTGARWWTEQANASQTTRTVLFTIAGAAIVVSTLSPFLLESWPVPFFVSLVVAATTLLVAANMGFTITVGIERIVIVSWLRWPRLTISMAEVAHANVTDAAPYEWGGIGIRSNGSQTGVILRKGEAIIVERTDGHQVVITVDHAAEGAALINSLIEG